MPDFESTLSVLALWGAIGYLAGSIPFGMVLARVMNLGNLRDIGSGSIGATNVLRTGSKPAAALTLLLDGAKGAVVVLVARPLVADDAVQLAALMALIGHCYPIWLKFNGGKGVATFLGLALALAWPVGIACCLVWLVTAAISRTSSMSSLTSASLSSALILVLGFGTMYVLFLLLTAIMFWRHRSNIRRIKAGTEPKIGQKS